jgi:hypothetical protein
VLGVAGNPGFVDVPESDASTYVTDQLAPAPRDMLLALSSRGIRVHRGCTAVKRIALTRKGLPGPPGIFQASFDCESKPKTVLVRVRAVAAAASPWKREPPAHLELRKTVSSAALSVQTPSRRPLGYVTISGKQVRIWISPACVRD